MSTAQEVHDFLVSDCNLALPPDLSSMRLTEVSNPGPGTTCVAMLVKGPRRPRRINASSRMVICDNVSGATTRKKDHEPVVAARDVG